MANFSKICVIGAGGVGFWVAAALSRDMPNFPIVVFDPDTVEGSGGKRLPIPPNSDGSKLKIDVLTDFVYFTLGGGEELQALNTLLDADWMQSWVYQNPLWVDCSDMSIASRQKLFAPLIGLNGQMRNYLRVSYDGNGWAVISRGLPFGPPEAVGYTQVPTFADSLAAGGIGAAAVRQWVEFGKPPAEYQVNIKTGECLSTYQEETNV